MVRNEGKVQGRDNSCTSGKAVRAGIENSQQVTKGTFQFPMNGLAGVMKYTTLVGNFYFIITAKP